MNILQLCQWDFAGCGYLLSEAINEHTEHHSRHIRVESSRLEYPYDVLNPTSQQIQVLCNWADVFHIHDAFVRLPGRFKKPTVITYHGSRYRKAVQKHHERLRRYGWVGTVATPDLTVYGLPWLPDCRPDLSEYVNRTPNFSIAHSPTKRKTKGTEQIERGLQGVYELDVIEGVTWAQCLKRRGRAHLTIDQFRAGYGCSAVEAWAMGQPVVSGGIPQVIDAIRRCVGYVPFYYCPENSTEIRESVRDLYYHADVYKQTVDAGMKCWKENHSPKAVAEKAIQFYNTAMNTYTGLRQQAVGTDRTAVVRYIGYPTQQMTFMANASGTHYEYSGDEREILIDLRDLDEFIKAKKNGKRLFKLVRRN